MYSQFQEKRVPVKVHHLVIWLFQEINRQRACLSDIAQRSGVGFNTLMNWRRCNNPKIDSIEAVMNVLGYTLSYKPIKENEHGDPRL